MFGQHDDQHHAQQAGGPGACNQPLAGPAAAGEWSFDWGGQGNFSGYGIDEEEVATNELNSFGFAAEGKVWAANSTVTQKIPRLSKWI